MEHIVHRPIDGIEAFFFEEIAGYIGFKKDVGFTTGHLFFKGVAFDILLFGTGYQFVEHGIGDVKRLVEFGHGLIAGKFLAMAVAIVEGILVEDAQVDDAVEVILGAIVDEGHIHVGYDATAAIDHFSFWGVVLQGVVQVDAVGGEEFAILVTIVRLQEVVFEVAVEGFLDAAARRCVIACHGDADG